MKRKERKVIVVLDMDEVLCDLMAPMSRDAAIAYGLRETPLADVTGFSTAHWPEQVRKFFYERALTYDYYRDLPLAAGADKIRKFFEIFDIVVTTATPGSDKSENLLLAKKDWLRENFGGAPFKFVSTSDKDAVFGDAIIDDHTDNIKLHGQAWGSYTVLIDKPWNHDGKPDHRATDVSDAFEHLARIIGKKV